jgi:hypothetical protein
MKVCIVYEMKFWPKYLYKGQGDFFTKASALVPTWSCHTTCGKFFQSIIGEETTEKVAYMKFEQEILCKMM